ncbi:MAG: hypothetical protein ACOYNJ_05875 [Candidatus Nanopelagicales bacterium]
MPRSTLPEEAWSRTVRSTGTIVPARSTPPSTIAIGAALASFTALGLLD